MSFQTSGHLDTWIMPDELCGASFHLFSVLLTFQNPICLENAATLLCCEAPEMFRGSALLWVDNDRIFHFLGGEDIL